MPSLQDLGTEVVAVGMLIGLLTQDESDSSNFTINTGWFDDPIEGANGLSSIPNRLDSLVRLLNDVLGPGVSVPGFVGDGLWYAIPDPVSGNPSLFCLVAPQGAPSSGQIGCGALYQYNDSPDNLIYSAYAYIPLFDYSPTGATWVIGNTSNPLQIGLTVSRPATAPAFSVGNVTFTALEVVGNIYFADQDPTVQVSFANLTNPPSQFQQPLTTLNDLLAPDPTAWIGEVVVQNASWLNAPISESLGITVGGVLMAGGFLSTDAKGNYQIDLAQLQTLTSAADIARHFLIGVLGALSDSDIPLPFFAFPGGGAYVARRDNADGTTDFGLRVALDFSLSSQPTGNGPPPTAIDLSFGSWPTGDTDDDNWVQRSNPNLTDVEPPGISVFLLQRAPDFSLSFAPGFALSSVGINVAGGANTPLLNIEGFTLQGVEIRGYLDSDGWIYGFAGRFDGVGFPLGPGFSSAVTGSETNPVAQNLLASGSGDDGGNGGDGATSNGDDGGGGADTSSGGEQNPVNPAFSVAGGYVQGGGFNVQLYDASDQPSTQVLIPIQRTLGPLRAEKLGIGWVQSNDMLSLLFDGGISLAGFSVDLQGLSIGVPLKTPNDFSKYDLDLDGLGMTLAEGPVEISAALVKLPPDLTATPPRNYTEYDGEALVKAASFSLQALGSYAYVPNPNGDGGYTSLFIFAILDAVLGGPEFFFVTGLAAGFGYNRALVLPNQSSVPQFPLVAGASDPSALGGTKQEDGSWAMPDPATALQVLDQFVPPECGEYWLAVGVRFTSFDLINSIALLTVEFGNELEIALLDVSYMTLPPPPEPGADAPPVSYFYGELGIEITVLPSEGVFTATGILTPNSFVIDPACQLTGGFAFYVWFGDNPHSGQFVLTLGGYHPDFKPPAYYPSVPRLGFNWPVSSEASISGDAYFALTPSAVMAGAGLHVTFNAGDLSAWFKGQMDALITWAPFSYLIDVSVDIGASYRAHIGSLTHIFKIDLSADVTIWGPPMGGQAHVNWTIISFTVNFGASQNDTPPPLAWINDDGTGFAQTLLPHTTPQGQTSQMTARAARATAQGAGAQSQTTPSGVYTITANDGLLKTFTDDNGDTVWVVRSNHFAFSALTAIPTTAVQITPATTEGSGAAARIDASGVSPAGDSYAVGIRPMNAVLSSSVLTITMALQDGTIYDLAGKFDNEPALSSVPAAKWGQPLPAGQSPEPNTLLTGYLMGLDNLTPRMPALTPNGANALDVDVATALAYDVVDRDSPDHLPLQPGVPHVPLPQMSGTALQEIAQTMMQLEQISARSDIFAALQGYGIAAGKNGELWNLAATPGAFFSDNPLLYLPPPTEPVWRRRNP
jgi:hypothetical protein